MAFQPVPNTAIVELRGVLHGQRVENTLHFQSATPIEQGDLQALVNGIGDILKDPGYQGFWPNEFIWTEVYARDLTTPIGPQASDTTVSGIDGGAGPGLPGNVTLAISLRSGLTGRSSRGRIYWMGLPEGQVVGNAVAGPYAASLVLVVEDIRNEAITHGFEMVVVSRQQQGVKLAVALTYPVINIGVNDLNIDSQRDRLTGRGE